MGMATRANTRLLLLLLPLVLAVLVVERSTAASPAAAAAPAAASPFRTVYAFGDSFTDTGNTHSTTGPYSFGYVSSPPYGATFHRSTNRYSDGRLVVDFLAEALKLPSFLPPYLSSSNTTAADQAEVGVNFAVPGATAIEHDFFARNNISFDLTSQSIMTQLGWFDAHLRAAAGSKDDDRRKKVGDALLWVGEIGTNDYTYTVVARDTIPAKLIRNMAVRRIKTFVEV